MRTYAIALLLTFTQICIAQNVNIKIVSAEADLEWTSRESEMQIKQMVKEKAITEALEKAFGKIFIQGNSTYIKNEQTGQTAKTSTNFNMISNTYVKGEVLQILEEKYDVREQTFGKGKNSHTIKSMFCQIKIEARELVDPPINFETYTLGKPAKNEIKSDFKEDKDGFFLYFKSPEDGFLTVFLDDTNTSEQLLPWKDMPAEYLSGMPIIANQEYIFFSIEQEHQYFNNKYFWNSEFSFYNPEGELQTLQRIFILFSKNRLAQPKLEGELGQTALTEIQKEKKWDVPQSMKSEDFQRWLVKSRQTRADLQVKALDITVIK